MYDYIAYIYIYIYICICAGGAAPRLPGGARPPSFSSFA